VTPQFPARYELPRRDRLRSRYFLRTQSIESVPSFLTYSASSSQGPNGSIFSGTLAFPKRIVKYTLYYDTLKGGPSDPSMSRLCVESPPGCDYFFILFFLFFRLRKNSILILLGLAFAARSRVPFSSSDCLNFISSVIVCPFIGVLKLA